MTVATSISIGGWNSTGTDTFGCKWQTLDMSGFEDTAPVRLGFAPLAGSDGAIDQLGFEDARVGVLTGVCVAPDRLTRQAAKNRLRAALGNLSTGIDVILHLEDGDFQAHGKRSAVAPIAPFGPIGFKYQATITFPDPRLYSTTLHTANLALVDNSLNPSGRWLFPASFPNDFGGPTVGPGQAVVVNGGTANTYGLITIMGPGDALRLDDQNTGNFMIISHLDVNQSVTLDMRLHRVLLNGTAPARYLLAAGSEWFAFSPGLDVVTFSAAAFTSASAQITWRDAT